MNIRTMEGGVTLTAEKRKNLEALSSDGSCKRAKAELTGAPWCNSDDADICDLTLLHLSDDVLLNIFRYCSPTDIRALSLCNSRLNMLCSDRSLWKRVDMRERRMGVKTLSLYLNSLPKNTTQSLCIRGLVGRRIPSNSKHNQKDDKVDKPDKEESKAGQTDDGNKASSQLSADANQPVDGEQSSSSTPANEPNDNARPGTSWTCRHRGYDVETCGDGEMMSNSYNVVKESGNSSPKPFSPTYDVQCSSSPLSSSRDATENSKGCSSKNHDGKCDTDDWTVTKDMMATIRKKCPDLKELRLEFCYIDCNAVQSSTFPSSLEALSLRGSICRNIPLARAYLFRLQDHCPNLAEIDLSRCDWLASHSLLVLSKVSTLKKLSLKHCWGLGECVAYASLSARYGFKSLEVLDIRGTPMGDSEITAFSLICPLKELLLQGSGVVEDSAIVGGVGGYVTYSPLLRNERDDGEPLSWETQDPAQFGEGWNWSSSDDEKENEKHDQGAGGNSPHAGDPVNSTPQLDDEGVDPFEAVGRVRVIYVDVRRAPLHNMFRLMYGPAQDAAPARQEDGEERPNNEEERAPPVDIRINNPGNENRAEVMIRREGDNHINFHVHYGNNDMPNNDQDRAPAMEVHIRNPANDNRAEGNGGPEVVIRREGDNPINFHLHYANNDMPNVEHRPQVIPEGAEYREVPVERHEQVAPPFPEILRRVGEMHPRRGENDQADIAIQNNIVYIENDPFVDHNGEDIELLDDGEVDLENIQPIRAPPGVAPEEELRNVEEHAPQPNPDNAPNNQNENRQFDPPIHLVRPGEFLRRGPAFVLYPNRPQEGHEGHQPDDQVFHRFLQHHQRSNLRNLLHDIEHTMRQLENYVAKFRTTDIYDRYVRRIHFFRRMLQQIYTTEPLFNTNRAIPEQRLAVQRDMVNIRRLIDASCHHLERLIARAIQYPVDEIPFRINYNLIDNPDQAEEGDNEDGRLRPETVEFYIQRYFGVPLAEEVNADEPSPRAPVCNRIPVWNPPLPRQVPGAAANVAPPPNNVQRDAANNPNPENQNARLNNQQQPNANARQNNGEEPGRRVNIRNFDIEIRQHDVQLPILPVNEPNQRDPNAAQRHVDEDIEVVLHDDIRAAMQQEYRERRNRNDRIEGPFVIRGDVVEDIGRRRRRVLHLPFPFNFRRQVLHNNAEYEGTSHLVTNASLLRFGVSKNVVQIGGNANLQQQTATRGGQLTTLVCRGYPRVTDRALLHLATAAPKLTRLDLSYTSVTRAGADAFRAERHDCELIVDHLLDDEQ